MPPPVRECLVVALLLVASAHAGFVMLRDWHGPALTLTNELYVPAALFAQGRGFVNPPLDELPGLREFLYWQGDATAWSPESLPETFSSTELDTYQRYHRYLIYGMGFTWRLLGVSWDAAKYYVVFLYVASVLAAYALLRTGLNRPLAFAGTLAFALSPTVLDVVYNVRDFSKAPFILALLALMMYLVRAPRSRKHWLIACVALGIVTGIGLGFRRDLLVCPPAVLAVLLFAPRPGGRALLERGAGILCFVLAGLVFSAPILESFRERGSLVYHDALMGTATEHDERIGLGLATYEKSPLKHDLYISITADLYAERVLGPNAESRPNPSLVEQSRLYFWSVLKMFPADFIARAWQTVFRVAEGVEYAEYQGIHPFPLLHGPGALVEAFAYRWGAYTLLFALLLLACIDMRIAIISTALYAYFSGITSLQYEARHAFHMVAPTYGLYLIPLQFGVAAWRKRVWTVDGRGAVLRRSSMRAGACFVLLIILVGAPLQAARAYQRGNLLQYERQLEQAALERIELRELDTSYGKLFRPEPPLLIGSDLPFEPYRRPLGEFLMVELEAYAPPMPIYIAYESSWGRHNYGGFMRALPAGGEPGGTLRYFFPAIEYRDDRDWSRFSGIAIPAEYGNPVRGLYRVTNKNDFAFHLNFALPENEEARVHAQRLRFPWNGPAPLSYWTFDDVHRGLMMAWTDFLLGNYDKARAQIDAFDNAVYFPFEVFHARLDLLGTEDDFGQYMAMAIEGMQRWPMDFSVAMSVNHAMMARFGLDERVPYWQQAEAEAPDSAAPPMMLGFTFAGLRRYEEAEKAFRRAKAIVGDKFGVDKHIAQMQMRKQQAATGQDPGGY